MISKFIIMVGIPFMFALNSSAQYYLADVQFDKINEGTVEEFLHRQIDNDIETFSDVKPSLSSTSSTEGYRFHEREYVIKDSLNKVWSYYLHTNPGDAWNAGKMGFGMLFSKKKNRLVYPEDKVECLETGQLVYLNLHLLKIKNIATAFEIITVDEANSIIEFSYVEDNTTHGKQQLNFVQTPGGYTKIVHRSYFKSRSVLRDHFLYPYFHTRLTNSYHRNMKKSYNSDIAAN